jgi:cation diffusion facilitator CzcD-associated flavoprotein CzcO
VGAGENGRALGRGDASAHERYRRRDTSANDRRRQRAPEHARPRTAPVLALSPGAARCDHPRAVTTATDKASGLSALEAAIARDLELLQYPRRSWVPRRTTPAGDPVLDVLVVGAGQGGLATAAALKRERVDNLRVVDENPIDRAGPWLRFARMITLRTPKHVTGPDLGLPNLTIQAWYEAQHGHGAWERLGLIPKETWAEYLSWYRRTLELPVQPETRVHLMRWQPDTRAFAVTMKGPTGEEIVHARRVVLATGIEGSGDWWVPAMVKDALPPERYAHTRWDIDFDALAGKRIAVLGAGASAFDNAAVALERGAAEVRLFFRRERLVDINAYRWAEYAGFLHHHGDLPDAERWRFIHQILRMGQLPPPDTFARARQHAGFHLHPGSPWTSLQMVGDAIRIGTPKGDVDVDFVIVGTGFRTDLSLRPELAEIESHVLRWSDRYTPPPAERHDDLSRHPYLGPSFQLLPRDPDATPWVSHVYNYTFGCLLSLGFGGASISGMKYSIPRLVGGITQSLFVEDSAEHFASLLQYDVKEW